jgi:hypothetical protein
LAGQSPQEPSWQSQEQDQDHQGWQSYSPPSATDGQETYAYPQSGAPAAPPAPGYGQGYEQDRAFAAPPPPPVTRQEPITAPPPPPVTRQEPIVAPQEHIYRAADQPYAGADQPYAGQSYAGADQPYAGQSYAGADQIYADQAYAGAGQSYAGADQAYAGADQAYAGADQSAPQWQGQAPSQWKARQGPVKAPSATRGFVASLFDFSFTSFVTPKIIKALYVLVTIWTVIWALIFIRLGFKYGGGPGGIAVLVIVVPVFGLLTLGAYRVLLEFFMIVHRIHDELKALREQSGDRG